jgi:hypothetical protein
MSAIIRRRAIQAAILVLALATAPFAAAQFWPTVARFVPPSLLSLVCVASLLYALLVWRTEWVFFKLFPGHPFPAQLSTSEKDLRRHRVAAGIGLLFSGFLAALWLKSIL